jgi:scyllo-inositol 2-dehydrogenase (NADP+)
VAVVDANEGQRDLVAKDWPGAEFFTSVDQMLAKVRPAVAVVATPHHLHAPIAIQLLNAGVNVICEKPMATTYPDAVAMCEAAEKAGRVLTVFHNRRMDPWFLAARDVIRDGLLGDVFETNIAIGGSNWFNGTWRDRKHESGGILFDWGVHLTDYALHFTDARPNTVSGFLYKEAGADPKRNELHGTVQIRFDNGSVANLTLSAGMHAPVQRFRIYGTKGTLVDEWNWSDSDKLKVYTRLGGGEPAVMEIQYKKTTWQQWYDQTIAAMAEGKDPMITARSAARNIHVLTLAEESHQRGGAPLEV